MKMKRFIVFLTMLTLVTAAVLAGCGRQEDAGAPSPADTPGAVTFTDDLGRTLTVNHPERVVCLISSFTDIWCQSGGADSVVAATDATWRYFDLPLDETVVNLGGTKDLDMEKLIACEPDLILASCGAESNVELQETFDDMGIPTAFFSVETFDDYLRMLKVCTDINGRPDLYESAGEAVREQVNAALNRQDGSGPSVLYIRATGSSCKVKSREGTVLGRMLADLGCVNIADSDAGLLEQLSLEAIMRDDPDYIFVILQSADPTEAEAVLRTTLLDNPAWASLTAVREDRCFILDSALYNLKPNARWGEAYEKLADILYPQA